MPRRKDAVVPTIEMLLEDPENKDNITLSVNLSFVPSEFQREFKTARLLTLTDKDEIARNYENATFGADLDPLRTVREWLRYSVRKVLNLTIPESVRQSGLINTDPTYSWMVGKFIGDDSWRMPVMFNAYVLAKSNLMNKLTQAIMDGEVAGAGDIKAWTDMQEDHIRTIAIETARMKVRKTRGTTSTAPPPTEDDGDDDDDEN